MNDVNLSQARCLDRFNEYMVFYVLRLSILSTSFILYGELAVPNYSHLHSFLS